MALHSDDDEIVDVEWNNCPMRVDRKRCFQERKTVRCLSEMILILHDENSDHWVEKNEIQNN